MNDDSVCTARQVGGREIVSSKRALFHQFKRSSQGKLTSARDMILVYKVEEGWAEAEYHQGWMSGESVRQRGLD